MFILKLKNKKEYEITPDQEKKISEKWSNYLANRKKGENKDVMIDFKGFKFLVSNIAFIEPVGNKKTSTGKMIEDINRQYFFNREFFLKQSPQEKTTKRKHFIDFIFRSMTGNFIPEDKRLEIVKLTHDFFKQNPYRMYPDITLYKHLFTGQSVAMGVKILLSVLAVDISLSKNDLRKNM